MNHEVEIVTLEASMLGKEFDPASAKNDQLGALGFTARLPTQETSNRRLHSIDQAFSPTTEAPSKQHVYSRSRRGA